MTGEPPYRPPASPLLGRPPGPIRVLVVDDSALTRRVLTAALNSAPDFEVVGNAANGQECFEKVAELRPDVVTLDVEMPGMDGLAVLRQLMARTPLPVVMVSYLTHEGAEATVRALLDGAVDFVPKPGGPILGSVATLREELVRKVRGAARSRPRIGRPRPPAPGPQPPAPAAPAHHSAPPLRPSATPIAARPPLMPPPAMGARSADGFDRLVIIGTSTGGPQALQTVVSDLHPDGRTAYVIVQHMPDGMTTVLADLLASASPLRIREARQNDRLAADIALLAPGDWHLRFGPRGAIELDQGPKVHWVRPSVDVALLSAAEVYGNRIVTAVLTGMGSDGADGAAAVKLAGGTVIAEDKSTCVVYGMPKAVVQRGAAEHVVPLPQVAPTIRQILAGSVRPRQPALA